MGSGFAGVGSVPAFNPHNEAYGQPDYEDQIAVASVWSSVENGVSLSGGEIDGRYYLSNEAAVRLAGMLLEASQPANIPGNGYEEWAKAARATVEKALDPAQGFEFDVMMLDGTPPPPSAGRPSEIGQFSTEETDYPPF